MRIISLTSIPSRFHYLNRTLESLLKQGFTDEIRLYIPNKYKRFNEWDGVLPKTPKGVNIIRINDDLGPATKILPCAMDLKGIDAQILFCDDDCIHPRNWARNLFETQTMRPKEAVATYGRLVTAELPDVISINNKAVAVGQRIDKNLQYRFERLLQKLTGRQALHRPIKKEGYVDLLFGVGGVVVRPEFFDANALEIPTESFFVDDIWLSAQLAKKGIAVFCPKRFPMPIASEASEIEALYDHEVSGNRFDQNRRAALWCRNNLGIWKSANE